MNNPRQKKQLIILVGLLVVLVVVFYQAMDSSFPPDVPKVGTISSSTTFDELDGYIFKIGQGKDRREQRLIPASEINPVIHFRKLKQIEPVEPSFSRNMFHSIHLHQIEKQLECRDHQALKPLNQ